jgi:hypothetical protein
MAFGLNGFGTTYLGARWQPDGTFVTTRWVIFFYVPIVPLGSVRVIEGSAPDPNPLSVGFSRMKVTAAPLDLGAVARTYAMEAGILLFLLFGVPILNRLVEKL